MGAVKTVPYFFFLSGCIKNDSLLKIKVIYCLEAYLFIYLLGLMDPK